MNLVELGVDLVQSFLVGIPFDRLGLEQEFVLLVGITGHCRLDLRPQIRLLPGDVLDQLLLFFLQPQDARLVGPAGPRPFLGDLVLSLHELLTEELRLRIRVELLLHLGIDRIEMVLGRLEHADLQLRRQQALGDLHPFLPQRAHLGKGQVLLHTGIVRFARRQILGQTLVDLTLFADLIHRLLIMFAQFVKNVLAAPLLVVGHLQQVFVLDGLDDCLGLGGVVQAQDNLQVFAFHRIADLKFVLQPDDRVRRRGADGIQSGNRRPVYGT